MSFHIDELEKIHKTSKGMFRGSLRDEISMMIKTFDQYVAEIKNSSVSEKTNLYVKYSKIAQGLRHSALAAGATNMKVPKWAAAAVVESWIALLRSENQSDISKGEEIINRMR